MFSNIKLREAKLRHEMDLSRQRLDSDKEEFELQKKIDALTYASKDAESLKCAKETIQRLEADLKIEKARSATIIAEQKSSYAEHVMAITDERVKEMRSTYEGYAKNITEIVKAANAGDVKVNTSVNSNS